MQPAYNFCLIIASTNDVSLCTALFEIDFSTRRCYHGIMVSDHEQKNSRRPIFIFVVLALWVIFKWMLELGTSHRLSWVELAVIVPLILMIKWGQFNQDSSNYPKMLAIFSGFCLFLLFLIYVFPSEIKSLVLLSPVD